jgi:hypothetical protein
VHNLGKRSITLTRILSTSKTGGFLKRLLETILVALPIPTSQTQK